MARLIERSIPDLRQMIHDGEVTREEVTRAFLDEIESTDDRVKAFLSVNREEALDRARDLDEEDDDGLLSGIPIAIKDNLCVEGQEVRCASKILSDHVTPYTATAVQNLLDEGAVLVGRTNLDEFAMGSSTENSAFGTTRNPHDLDRVPGGSSGGSAAAVAARMVPGALGSDTGGSVRQPASLCGVHGVKPTYGRVSRYGLVAFASSLDQIGPFAGTAEGAALLTRVISGKDPADSTSLDEPVPAYDEDLRDLPDSLNIGVPEEYFGDGIEPAVRDNVEAQLNVLRDAGHSVEECSLPHTDYAISVYYILCTAEASSNLARYDGVRYGHRAEEFDDLVDMYRQTRAEGFGEEVKRRIMLGTFVLSSGYYEAYYGKAQKVRTLIKRDFDEAFEEHDLLLTPTSPTTAFPIGEKTDDPVQMYLSDICTISANLAGIPAVSVPTGIDEDDLPIGTQLLAPNLEERNLFRAANLLENGTGTRPQQPPAVASHGGDAV